MVCGIKLCVNNNLSIMKQGNGSKRAQMKELSPLSGSRREAIQS